MTRGSLRQYVKNVVVCESAVLNENLLARVPGSDGLQDVTRFIVHIKCLSSGQHSVCLHLKRFPVVLRVTFKPFREHGYRGVN
jgi:hypothetical protein